MVVLVISLLFFLAGCSCDSQDEEGGIRRKDVVLLTDLQVSNFIYVLPGILEFSEKYNKSLSREEKNREDANKRFFETLRKSKKIEKLAGEYGFKSIDELITVYKNVVLGYMSIKVELQDFEKDTSNLISIILSNENRVKNDFSEKKINEKEYNKQMREIDADKMRLKNILLIKKYETEIDKVTSEYNK